MPSWRDTILKDFVSSERKLTLVADPDGLLTEEKLALALRGRGFELIEFGDPVEFRYAYEPRYRSVWDRGESTDRGLILRWPAAELEALPYDLLQAGRRLSFSLGRLFPKLSYPVLEELDRSLLDALFEAQRNASLNRIMGDNATKDFILQHVFRITAKMIENEVELLRVLLRLHYGQPRLSLVLAERLVRVLQGREAFKTWPLSEIVPDAEAFFAFLQERWPIFLARFQRPYQLRDSVSEDVLKYPGPDWLPFDHRDIKVYIDNLFLERKLTPVEANAFEIELEAESWVRSGIATSEADDDELRASRLFDLVKEKLPSADALHSDWTSFALKWAELASLVHGGNGGTSAAHQAQLRDIGDAMNKLFVDWLVGHYSSLINLPPTHPAMLHHVPRRLAWALEGAADSCVALIVMDGLALDQWVTVRSFLQKQDARLVMREAATFAWIPTLTSVSRQAIFAGKPPLYFPSSIYSTHREERLWQQFWEARGVPRRKIAYQRGLGDGEAADVLAATIHPRDTQVVGLVIDKVDKIMHGMQLGSAGMHNQIKQWCRAGFLSELVGQLLDDGYKVWLTADHGNIQCEGRGRPTEGSTAEIRGERVRIYRTPELRARVVEEFPFAKVWQPIGLPADCFPLVAGGRDAFVTPGASIVGHGGVALEEVIVPLVKFERRTR